MISLLFDFFFRKNYSLYFIDEKNIFSYTHGQLMLAEEVDK